MFGVYVVSYLCNSLFQRGCQIYFFLLQVSRVHAPFFTRYEFQSDAFYISHFFSYPLSNTWEIKLAISPPQIGKLCVNPKHCFIVVISFRLFTVPWFLLSFYCCMIFTGQTAMLSCCFALLLRIRCDYFLTFDMWTLVKFFVSYSQNKLSTGREWEQPGGK